MLFMMLISLYTSRVILATLGITDFGVYNVVGGVVVLFSFLNSAMVGSTQRFLNFELGRGDGGEAKRVFSMSINCQLLIILIVLFLSETIGLWFLNTYLKIPVDRMAAANWVYQFSVLATCVGIYYAPYNAAIIAYEKMSIYAYISILEVILKLAIVYMLLIGQFDKLILFSFLTFVVTVIISSIYIRVCIHKFEICHYKRFWDKELFKRLMSFSGWSLFGSVANVGVSQGLNIIQNMFFGVAINAAMGVANQVNGAIFKFLSNFCTAYNPQIVKSYASGDKEYFMKLLYRTSKFSYFMMLILSLPVIICCSDILNIWLKDVPDYAVSFCQLMICYSLVEAMSTPLWMAVQANGNIKYYQINISVIKLVSLPICILVLSLGASPVYVLLINVFDNIANHIYRLIYLCKRINFDIMAYIKAAMLPCMIVTFLSFPIPTILKMYFHGYFWTFAIIFITVVSVALTKYHFGLERSEKEKMVSVIFEKIRKK